jgi:hypothetical protein
MAIQYPDFRADPNSVPNAGGWQNVISNVQKGYMLSQLPAQMKMQRALQQAQLQKAQQEAYYYPQQQESQLGLQRAQTEGAQLQNQYYPQLTEAQLSQSAAQTGLLGQQSAMYRPLTQSQIDLNRAQAAKAGQADNGITIGTDADGRPIIQIGGTGGGGARSGGRLGVDDKGNVTSELTTPNKTAVQNRKIGDDIVKPFIDQIVANVPQFQTHQKRAQAAVSGLFNQFGAGDWLDQQALAKKAGLSSALPSQLATGQSAIINSTEGLVKALGLRPTDQQTAMIQKALAPQRGESEKGYRARVLDFARTLSNNTNQSQKLLATGLNTGVNINGPQTPMSIDDQIASAEAALARKGGQ